MKKCIRLILFTVTISFLYSCKKYTKEEIIDYDSLEKTILNDFTLKLAIPNYATIKQKAIDLNMAVVSFDTQPTDTHLQTVQIAWKNLREPWEQCESWLFGPIEDLNFDPELDDWPVNHVDLDSVLTGNSPLDLITVQGFQNSLKGFHPLEYIIFGLNGNKTASQITTREREYMKSLALHIQDIADQLYESWNPSSTGNFCNEVINAGAGSNRFAKRKDAFVAIISAMAGICDEVANGKMEEPFINQDPALEESPYANNSLIDFKNNIIGVRNVYLCQFINDGHGLNEWVALRNMALDNKLQQQITTAILAFDNISIPYAQAIFSQQVQIIATQNAINNLRGTIEDELLPFVEKNITE